jgi:drug/metabolite transporter (DMT)-like permease
MAPATFVVLRATMGAALLGGLILARPRLWTPLAALPGPQRRMLALAVVLNGAFNLALFSAFDSVGVGIVLAIYFTYPVVVWAASVALGRERVTALRCLALLLATVGAVAVVAERAGSGGSAPLGLALAVAAALGQASYLVVSRRGFPDVTAEQAVTLVLVGGAVMAVALIVVADGPGGAAGGWVSSPAAWLCVAAAGILGTAAAKVWVLRGLRLLGGTRTAVLMLIEPVGGVLLAALVLQQRISALEAVGGFVILGAAVLVQRPAPSRSLAE